MRGRESIPGREETSTPPPPCKDKFQQAGEVGTVVVEPAPTPVSPVTAPARPTSAPTTAVATESTKPTTEPASAEFEPPNSGPQQHFSDQSLPGVGINNFYQACSLLLLLCSGNFVQEFSTFQHFNLEIEF